MNIKKGTNELVGCCLIVLGGTIIQRKYDNIITTIFLTTIIYLLYKIVIADIREHIIPNKILFLINFVRLIWICFSEQRINDLIYSIMSSAIILFIVCIIKMFSLKSKLIIGDGDYKLLIVLSFCFGIEKLLISLLISLVITLLCSAFFISKNKTKKIPAAPIFVFGTIVLCFFGGGNSLC